MQRTNAYLSVVDVPVVPPRCTEPTNNDRYVSTAFPSSLQNTLRCSREIDREWVCVCVCERERERERERYVEPCRENYLLGVHFLLETDRMIGVTSLLVDVAFDGFLSEGIHIRLFLWQSRWPTIGCYVHIAAAVKELYHCWKTLVHVTPICAWLCMRTYLSVHLTAILPDCIFI